MYDLGTWGFAVCKIRILPQHGTPSPTLPLAPPTTALPADPGGDWLRLVSGQKGRQEQRMDLTGRKRVTRPPAQSKEP